MSSRTIREIVHWLVTLALLLGIIYFERDDIGRTHREGQRPPKTIYSAVATPYGCEKLFGLQAVRSIVHSQYAYESPMLGATAIDDIDCMLPGGAQETVSLPGYSTDHYGLRLVTGIAGSGIASCWLTPWNGHVCLLHLSVSFVGFALPRIMDARLFPPGVLYEPKRRLSGDEMTALSVMAQARTVAPPGVAAAATSGGFVLGRSGWPSSYEFSNGSCGDSVSCSYVDAHLCVVLDWAAARFFLTIVNGSHKRPPPAFSLKRWNAYLKPRHKPLISAYHKGKLTRAAQAWRWHQTTYRGIAAKHYYGKTATRHVPYTLWRWRCGKGYVWPKAIKLQKAACLD